jgi:hypothetical protein
MTVNPKAKLCFSNGGNPFHPGVAGCNAYVGNLSGRVRRSSMHIDFVNYIHSEKSKWIYAKRNIDGIRR